MKRALPYTADIGLPSELGTRLSLGVDLRGAPDQPAKLRGRLYAQAQDVELAGIGRRLGLGDTFRQGAAQLQLWIDLQPGRRYDMVARLSADDLQLALHPDMGPGGLLWRSGDGAPWTSLEGASAWGVEQLVWPECWSVGHGQNGPADRPFAGSRLDVTFTATSGF